MGSPAVAPMPAWWRRTPEAIGFQNLMLDVTIDRVSRNASTHNVRYSRVWIGETILKAFSPCDRLSKNVAAHGFLEKFFQKNLHKLYM